MVPFVPVAVAEAEQAEAWAFVAGCSMVLPAFEKAATTALLVLELAVTEEKLVEAAEERAEAAPEVFAEELAVFAV